MAGGIFDERPFSINIKCILLTLLIVILYWFVIPKFKESNKLFIFIISFILTSILFVGYDSLYECSVPKFRSINYIIKTFLISFIISLLILFLPTKSLLVLLFLLWLPYILQTWYDYLFECNDRLNPTIIPFGRYIFLPFKPPDYQERWRNLPLSQKLKIQKYDRFFAILGVGIFLTFLIYYILKK